MIFDAKYPEIIKPEPPNTFDMKTLGSSTSGFLKQSTKGTNASFKGDKPLEKFGRFSKIDDVQNAPAMNEQVMNDSFPETTVSSPS